MALEVWTPGNIWKYLEISWSYSLNAINKYKISGNVWKSGNHPWNLFILNWMTVDFWRISLMLNAHTSINYFILFRLFQAMHYQKIPKAVSHVWKNPMASLQGLRLSALERQNMSELSFRLNILKSSVWYEKWRREPWHAEPWPSWRTTGKPWQIGSEDSKEAMLPSVAMSLEA